MVPKQTLADRSARVCFVVMPRTAGFRGASHANLLRRATFLASVRTDFLDILTYMTESSGSLAVGEDFVRRLRRKCHELVSIEGIIGCARPELHPRIRSIPFKNHVIFFQYADDRFDVVRIIEGYRDIDVRFRGDRDAF